MDNLRVAISCSTKFHAFNLAEQLERHHLLYGFWTTYAYQKNLLARHFVSRIDQECISPDKIHTLLSLAVLIKKFPYPALWNEYFDLWVSSKLTKYSQGYDVFIGWSGMSLQSIRSARKSHKITLLERGSAHIEFQNRVLQEEYARMGLKFQIDPKVIRKEVLEYQECDFISIPSKFARNTFLEFGIPESKLLVTPYGSNNLFKANKHVDRLNKKITILYLGPLSFRKGVHYLFEALEMLENKKVDFEVWFVGGLDPQFEMICQGYKMQFPKWKFWGHVNHYDLPKYITQCDIGVCPSIEDGFGMVVPQMLACGVPVITTTNTGAADLIRDGENGYVISIKSPEEILDRLLRVYEDADLLERMRQYLLKNSIDLSWDRYGESYLKNIKNCIR